MSLGERTAEYLAGIGHATEDVAKAALFKFLYRQYTARQILGVRGYLEETGIGEILDAIRNGKLSSSSTAEEAKRLALANPNVYTAYLRWLASPERTRLGECHFLARRFAEKEGWDSDTAVVSVAAAVTNKVFDEQASTDGGKRFAEANEGIIEELTNEIASNEELCELLSGAAYNSCYARYGDAGGCRGMFSNKFLAYVRALSSGWHGRYSPTKMELAFKFAAEIRRELGDNVLASLESMSALGIFRPLPRNPNERKFYDAVRRFAASVGVPLEGSQNA